LTETDKLGYIFIWFCYPIFLNFQKKKHQKYVWKKRYIIHGLDSFYSPYVVNPSSLGSSRFLVL